ncbi:uncharacterized protein ACA1_175210 [Acanthamoeba castellanii str. Neff]|uniref:Uncharacterized protein n=1 Tax=Acanthamoeba castellanii (strain ATCC 30010 / Neff) TaxID=1257118 RepID=L8HI05_ACACF|nr:uncharacterized protein ACA1_175210 [Acanthamoeba castellanii str. Neff]ELR24847.1 hypothetical protein ACA1_175210 [Acanthamoeba castellanii str. Neff]
MNGRYYDDDAGGGRFIPWCDALLVLPACYTAHWRDSDYDVDDEARFATGVCCAAAVLERWKVCPSVCWCGGASRAWCASCRGIATLLTDFRHGALTACAVLALGPAGLDAASMVMSAIRSDSYWFSGCAPPSKVEEGVQLNACSDAHHDA